MTKSQTILGYSRTASIILIEKNIRKRASKPSDVTHGESISIGLKVGVFSFARLDKARNSRAKIPKLTVVGISDEDSTGQ